jgi:hypothetical protein
MDADLREELHRTLPPCNRQEFFNEYSEAHREKFGEDFALAVGGEW